MREKSIIGDNLLMDMYGMIITDAVTGSFCMCSKLFPKIHLDPLIIDNQLTKFDLGGINNVKSSNSDTLAIFYMNLIIPISIMVIEKVIPI